MLPVRNNFQLDVLGEKIDLRTYAERFCSIESQLLADYSSPGAHYRSPVSCDSLWYQRVNFENFVEFIRPRFLERRRFVVY